MICPGCGREIPENSNKSLHYLIIAIIAVVVVISIFLLRTLSAHLRRQPEDEDSLEVQSGDVEMAVEETDEEVPSEEIPSEEIRNPDTENLLVAVPADYMYLRQTPGFGDDEIAEVRAGQYLQWDDEVVTENDRNFFKVTVEETGQEGYLNADYCIPVNYRYAPDTLSIVDVTDSLYTYDKMKTDIETLCTTYGECLSCEVPGSSVDGRDIYEVRLGAADAEHHIFVQAAIHGREYMTAQLVMRMLEYYAANYDSGSYNGKSYRELLQNVAIHVIPMSNPDGVTISQLGAEAMYHEEIGKLVHDCYLRDRADLVHEKDANGDWNWADYYTWKGFDREAEGKTEIISFEEYQKLWKSNANGVDLNQNFNAGWDDIDLRKKPSFGSYKGAFAVSEPETQILVEEAQKREYDYYISYHSRGQLIYYDVNGNEEETSEKSYTLASDLQKVLKYEPVNTRKAYNVNLGGFSDWVQLDLQGASVTIENGRHPCPLNIEEFEAMWQRNREAWAMLCEKLCE